MKSLLLATAVAAGMFALSSPSFADKSGAKRSTYMSAFGEVGEVKLGEKMMHMQMFEDPTGDQFVVFSRAEAEALLGGMDLGTHKWTKMK